MRFWPLIRLVPRHTHFNFVGLAPYAAILSLLLVIGSGVSIATRGMNFGIDFAGGTSMEVTTPGVAPIGKLRGALSAMGAHDSQVQEFGNPHSAKIAFRSVAGQTEQGAANYVAARLQQQFSGLKVSGQST